MLDVELFARSAAGPHLINLLLHACNTLLLFTLLRGLTGAHWRSAMVAGLFALHPLRVESVAWIAERKDVLSAFFGLLALWAYAAYAQSKGLQDHGLQDHGPQDRRPLRTGLANSGFNVRRTMFHPSSHTLYLLSLVLFALGLMSKPMLVTLPCVMLLLDYWPLQRFGLFDNRAR